MPDSKDFKIPNTYHFIWIGTGKPYFLLVAIESVLLRCEDSKVILWTDNEDDSFEVRLLKQNPRFSTKKINISGLIEELENGVVKDVIKGNFDIAGTKSNTEKKQITKPIERSRSNLLRYLILYMYGGVYLDADTLVLKDMSPLLSESTGFIGKENAAWPIVGREQIFHRFFKGPLLEIIRFIAIKLPFGYKLNRFYASVCSASENNAILGFAPRHNYLYECFNHIAKMDKEDILKSLRLGPFLLQKVSKDYKKNDLKTYSEVYFYPYGPFISQHYFRKRDNASLVASQMVSDGTYVLHWGASSKFLYTYTRDNLKTNSSKSVFTLLENRVITEYETTPNI